MSNLTLEMTNFIIHLGGFNMLKLKLEEVSKWYKNTTLGSKCTKETHCVDCDLDGLCEPCDTVEGVYAGSNTLAGLGGSPVGASGVFAHASTCDGPCMELTSNQLLNMDPQTQLAYCDGCLEDVNPEIRKRIEEFEKAGYPDSMINSNPLQQG